MRTLLLVAAVAATMAVLPAKAEQVNQAGKASLPYVDMIDPYIDPDEHLDEDHMVMGGLYPIDLWDEGPTLALVSCDDDVCLDQSKEDDAAVRRLHDALQLKVDWLHAMARILDRSHRFSHEPFYQVGGLSQP